MTTLADRAEACAGFRWMAGMAYVATCTDGGYTQRGRATEADLSFDGLPTNKAWTAVPDLGDPATLGCLLALVREAWGQRVTLSPISMGGAWRVGDAYGWAGKSQNTEAEALVATLEAAPQPGPVTP